MVSYLHVWALRNFLEMAEYRGDRHLTEKCTAMLESVINTCEEQLWDGDWYIRGITASGRKIGTAADKEGQIHLESNAWAVLSGAASAERGRKAMDSVYERLFTPFGIMLNGPAYTECDD